jgi:hypothetical protein
MTASRVVAGSGAGPVKSRRASWRRVFQCILGWQSSRPRAALYAVRGARFWCRQWRSGGSRRPDGPGQLLVRCSAADHTRPARTRNRCELTRFVQRSLTILPARISRLAWSQRNTFTAYIAPANPELGLDLPPNTVGDDSLPASAVFAVAPSGSGFQLSLYGLAGVLLALDERFELNVLGLDIGFDAVASALKLSAIGRLGLDR